MEILDADGPAAPFEHACINLADLGNLAPSPGRPGEDQRFMDAAPAFQHRERVGIERDGARPL